MTRAFVLAGLLSLASNASAQSWQPTDFSDPFPPDGTRVCAEGAGGRICLGLFCDAPGTGLRLGYLNSTYPGQLPGVDVLLTVDDPTRATNMIGTYASTAELERTGPYPYFYGTGAIASDQAGPVLEALKRGSTVYITAAGDSWGLPLRGSAREIARVEALCGAPARAGPAFVPDMVIDAPGPPLRISSPDAPASAMPPSAPPLPSGDALEVGTARWAPIPPDPAEDIFGTQLCHPARPGAEPLRCLRLLCFSEGEDLGLFYVDFGTPGDVFQPGWPWPVQFTAPSDRSAVLELSVAADSRELIAVGQPDPDAWHAAAGILSGGTVRIDTPHGAALLRGDGFDAEIARTAKTCAVPPVPAQTDGAAPARVRLVFGSDERDAIDPATMHLVEEAHGETIAEYRAAIGQDLTGFSARAFRVGADDVLLATMLCGAGGWFGADGCLAYLDVRRDGRWSNVFTDSTLAFAGTIDLDATRAEAGWPAIVLNGGATLWRWNGRSYEIAP